MLLFDEKKLTKSLFRSKTGSSNTSHYLSLLSEFNLKYFRWITLAGILTTGLSVWLAFEIKVEANRLDCFTSKSPERISSEFVEKELAGVRTLDISFKAGSNEAFKRPENLFVIEALHLNPPA